jgi:hypothetical protein
MGVFGMTGEPTEEKDIWDKTKGYFLDNPTLAVTLLYVYVTANGIFYSAWLYGSFGINIFDYSETADFLLAAFKNPVAFLFAGIQVAIGVAYALWQQLRVRRFVRSRRQQMIVPEEEMKEEVRRLEEASERHLRRQRAWLIILVPVSIVVISLIAPYGSAARTAHSLKEGDKPAVEVRYRSFSGSAGQVTVPGLELIGATQRAAFFYDVNDKDNEKDNHTLVIPQSQIVSIKVPE